MKCNWISVKEDYDHKIVFIEDAHPLMGGMSITNDAESVLKYHHVHFGIDWRVVYKDTDNEWWEMFWSPGWKTGDWRIAFKPWHSLEWDILSKK